MFNFLAEPIDFDAIQNVVWFSSWNLRKKYNNGLFILRTRALPNTSLLGLSLHWAHFKTHRQ